MKARSYFYVLFALMAGCALLGLEQAGTFNDRLGYAVSTHTEILTFVAREVNAGQMSGADGERHIETAQNARELADEARTVMASGDTKTAEGKVQLAIAILRSTKNYLEEN